MANSIPFYGPIDLTGNELQNAKLQNLASAPAAATGLVYYDTNTGLIGVSNGTEWTYLAKADGALDPNQVHDIVAGMLSGSSQIVSTYNSSTGSIVLTIGNAVIKDANIASDANISADKIVAGTNNAVYTTGEKSKLAAVAPGATANSTDAFLLNRTNHTGTQSADTITDGSTNKAYTATEKTKLAGVQTGATANQTDTYLLSRANHTGTQPSSTISDFNSAVSAIANAAVSAVVDAAPGTLDTLNELAAALGDDPNFATTISNQLATKANISSLSTVATTGKYSDLTGKPIYVATVGDGTSTDIVVTHALGSRDVDVTLRQSGAPYSFGMVPWDATSNTTITLHFGTAPAAGAFSVKISQ